MDMINEMYDTPDPKTGKPPVETSAESYLNFDKRPGAGILSVDTVFKGLETRTHENTDSAKYGGPYYLFQFEVTKALKDNEQPVIEGEIHSLYIEGTTSDRKKAAVKAEFNTFVTLLAAISGESVASLYRNKERVKELIATGCEAFVGNEYHVGTELQKEDEPDGWYNYTLTAI